MSEYNFGLKTNGLENIEKLNTVINAQAAAAERLIQSIKTLNSLKVGTPLKLDLKTFNTQVGLVNASIKKIKDDLTGLSNLKPVVAITPLIKDTASTQLQRQLNKLSKLNVGVNVRITDDAAMIQGKIRSKLNTTIPISTETVSSDDRLDNLRRLLGSDRSDKLQQHISAVKQAQANKEVIERTAQLEIHELKRVHNHKQSMIARIDAEYKKQHAATMQRYRQEQGAQQDTHTKRLQQIKIEQDVLRQNANFIKLHKTGQIPGDIGSVNTYIQRLKANEARKVQGVTHSIAEIDKAIAHETRALKTLEGQYARMEKSYNTAQSKKAIHAQRLNDQLIHSTKTAAHEFAQQWENSIKRISRLVAVYFVYRAVFSVQTVIAKMQELEISIARIRTISQDAQLSISKWTDEVIKLSNTYGNMANDVSEGVYQVVTNQMAKGIEATQFMNQALQFSIASVSSARDAVALLTGGLNSYGLSAASVQEISASFFKTIELGRVRADEMADAMGRILPIANQLGIPLDQINAGIAAMTIQGIKFTTASTQMRNILLKMIVPTKGLKELFQSWGVESGEAAIQIFGFEEVLRRITKLISEGGTAEAGRLFSRIQAIAGIVALTRNNLDDYTNALAKYEDKVASYLNAVDIGMDSNAKRLEIYIQQMRNYLQVTFGRGAIDTIVSFIGFVGGTDNVIKGLTLSVKTTALAFASWKTIQIAKYLTRPLSDAAMEVIRYQVLQKTMTAGTEAQTAALMKQEIMLYRTGKAMTFLSTALKGAALLIGVSYAIKTLYRGIEIVTNVNRAYNQLLSGVASSTTMVDRLISRQIELYNKAGKSQKEFASEVTRKETTKLASEIAELNKELDKNANIVNRLKKLSSTQYNAVTTSLSRYVSALEAASSKSMSLIKSSRGIVRSNTGPERAIDQRLSEIDNIKEVSDEWRKARTRMIDYIQSKTALTTDDMNYATRLRGLLALRRQTMDVAREAYGRGDMDTGRKLIEQTIGMTEKLQEYGLTYNEVLQQRARIIESQSRLETRIMEKEKERLYILRNEQAHIKSVQKDIAQDQEKITALHQKYTESKDPEEQLKLQTEIEKIQNQMLDTLRNVKPLSIDDQQVAIQFGSDIQNQTDILGRRVTAAGGGVINAIDQLEKVLGARTLEVDALQLHITKLAEIVAKQAILNDNILKKQQFDAYVTQATDIKTKDVTEKQAAGTSITELLGPWEKIRQDEEKLRRRAESNQLTPSTPTQIPQSDPLLLGYNASIEANIVKLSEFAEKLTRGISVSDAEIKENRTLLLSTTQDLINNGNKRYDDDTLINLNKAADGIADVINKYEMQQRLRIEGVALRTPKDLAQLQRVSEGDLQTKARSPLEEEIFKLELERREAPEDQQFSIFTKMYDTLIKGNTGLKTQLELEQKTANDLGDLADAGTKKYSIHVADARMHEILNELVNRLPKDRSDLDLDLDKPSQQEKERLRATNIELEREKHSLNRPAVVESLNSTLNKSPGPGARFSFIGSRNVQNQVEQRQVASIIAPTLTALEKFQKTAMGNLIKSINKITAQRSSARGSWSDDSIISPRFLKSQANLVAGTGPTAYVTEEEYIRIKKEQVKQRSSIQRYNRAGNELGLNDPEDTGRTMRAEIGQFDEKFTREKGAFERISREVDSKTVSRERYRELETGKVVTIAVDGKELGRTVLGATARGTKQGIIKN